MTGNGHVRTITCLNCKCDLPNSEFYRKGERFDSRCRKCVLARKKSKCLEKKALLAKQKQLRMRTRMIDLSDFEVAIDPGVGFDAYTKPVLFEDILETLQCQNVPTSRRSAPKPS